jgi:hypothetical protein
MLLDSTPISTIETDLPVILLAQMGGAHGHRFERVKMPLIVLREAQKKSGKVTYQLGIIRFQRNSTHERTSE